MAKKGRSRDSGGVEFQDEGPTGRLPLPPAPSTLRAHGPELMVNLGMHRVTDTGCPVCREPEALDRFGLGFNL
jgi:hypothetical protein